MKNCGQAAKWKSVTTKAIIAFVFTTIAVALHAQKNDSVAKQEKFFRNSIKLNLTSNILYRNSYLFGYERIVNKHQSLNIMGGYQEFPLSLNLNLPGTKFENTRQNSGYSIAADYRFYLAKTNKCLIAPQGVYLAPFVAFQHFQSQRGIRYTSDGVTDSTDLNTSINLLNIGGGLGYQFVLGKRFVIDAMMFGPALTHYTFNARLSQEIDGLDTNETLQAVIDALKEKFPKLNDLSGEEGINGAGTESFWSAGFRYTISFGFRF